MMKKIPIRLLSGAQRQSLVAERFKIRRLEDIVGPDGLVHELHRHDFFFLLVIADGSGSHEIDFEHFQVGPKNIYFLRPGQVHRLSLDPGISGYLLEFNSGFYCPADGRGADRLSRASHKNFCQMETGRFERLCSLLEMILQEIALKEPNFADAVRSALDLFFIGFLRQGGAGNSPAVLDYGQERFEELVALLDEHIFSHKQVSEYTSMMNLSAYQLGEITKSAVGRTVSELISERIVLEAKRYLIATTSQVKEIAEILGYDDPSYFIRFFKKQTGVSPETFRRNSR
jgi:AraC-like DNA-binding protein